MKTLTITISIPEDCYDPSEVNDTDAQLILEVSNDTMTVKDFLEMSEEGVTVSFDIKDN